MAPTEQIAKTRNNRGAAKRERGASEEVYVQRIEETPRQAFGGSKLNDIDSPEMTLVEIDYALIGVAASRTTLMEWDNSGAGGPSICGVEHEHVIHNP